LIPQTWWSIPKGAITNFKRGKCRWQGWETTDEEQVLRRHWVEKRLWRYGGWVTVSSPQSQPLRR